MIDVGAADLFTVDIVAYTGAGTSTFRYATKGFVTGPNETPANTFYEERVRQAASINRTAFGARSIRGRSTTGFGDVVLHNLDSALEPFLNYGLDGRAITIKRYGGPGVPGKITSRAGTWSASGVTLAATAARINDGDLATNAWHTDAAVSGAYVQTDMGVPTTFSRLRIYAASAGNAGNYKVRGSANGSTWTDLATGFIPSASGWNEINFNPATYRYWRAELTNTPGAGAWLNEAEFSWWLTTVLVATMQGAQFSQMEVAITLRDRQQEMLVPVQTTKYAGSGSLEGGDDLKGKPKPLVFGKVLNIQPPLVESGKLIYQVTDSAAASIDAVYDRGVSLKPSYPARVQASGSASTVKPISSTDHGVNWTANANALSGAVGVMKYLNGIWIAANDTGSLWTSQDGETWTSRTSALPVSTSGIFGAAYGSGKWIISCDNGKMFYSTDEGVTWTQVLGYPWTTNYLRSILFANNLWVVTMDNAVAVSPDGLNWQKYALATATYLCCTYGVALYVVAGDNGGSGDPKIYTSPDGVTWTSRTAPVGIGGDFRGAAYNGTTLLLVGISGTTTANVATSTDGTTWTARTPATNKSKRCAVWDGTNFVVGGDGTVNTTEIIEYSAAGTTWTKSTSVPGSPVSYTSIRSIDVGQGGAADSYANSTDLLDNTKAPPAGKFKPFLDAAGSYFRLGASPVGPVTADVTEGSTAADRTVAQIYKRLLVRAGKSASDYSAGDLTTLDAAANYVVGVWIETEEMYAAVFDRLAASVLASWFIDKSGLYRIRQLLAPPGSATYAFVANDLVKPLVGVKTNGQGEGLPTYKTILRYQKNYAPTSDFAASVAMSRRVFSENEWREVSSTDASVQTAHLLAIQTVDETLLSSATDAGTEASRRQTLCGVQRRFFEAAMPYNDETQPIDLFDAIKLTHSRFNLSGGAYFVVLGVNDDAETRERLLTVWGATP